MNIQISEAYIEMASQIALLDSTVQLLRNKLKEGTLTRQEHKVLEENLREHKTLTSALGKMISSRINKAVLNEITK